MYSLLSLASRKFYTLRVFGFRRRESVIIDSTGETPIDVYLSPFSKKTIYENEEFIRSFDNLLYHKNCSPDYTLPPVRIFWQIPHLLRATRVSATTTKYNLAVCPV